MRQAPSERGIDPHLHRDITELIEGLEFEHQEQERATAEVSWYKEHTLFFSLV
ncbi:hypothetical protein ACFWPV_33645 [Streptomyces uncialis]|uniref:hypothetical protein n=1 Tax=Streptomyces uncialis TaxID=1048205 RepID=UPI00365FAFF4